MLLSEVASASLAAMALLSKCKQESSIEQSLGTACQKRNKLKSYIVAARNRRARQRGGLARGGAVAPQAAQRR